MGLIANCIGIIDSALARIDPPRADGSRGPFYLRTGPGLVGSAIAQNGDGPATVTLSADGSAIVVPGVNGTTVPTTAGGDAGKVLTVTGAGAATWQVPASTFGSPAALDANHIYAWSCKETSGNLLERVGGTCHLVPAGTPDVDYHMGSRRLLMGGKSFRVIRNAAHNGAGCAAGTANVPANTSITIECAVCADYNASPSEGLIFCASDRSALNRLEILSLLSSGTPTIVGRLIIGGSMSALTAFSSSFGTKHHVAITWADGGGASSLNIWIDGVVYTTNSPATPHLPKLTDLAIGGTGVVGTAADPFMGDVADVRISNIARGQAYMLAATDAVWAQ